MFFFVNFASCFSSSTTYCSSVLRPFHVRTGPVVALNSNYRDFVLLCLGSPSYTPPPRAGCSVACLYFAQEHWWFPFAQRWLSPASSCGSGPSTSHWQWVSRFLTSLPLSFVVTSCPSLQIEKFFSFNKKYIIQTMIETVITRRKFLTPTKRVLKQQLQQKPSHILHVSAIEIHRRGRGTGRNGMQIKQ